MLTQAICLSIMSSSEHVSPMLEVHTDYEIIGCKSEISAHVNKCYTQKNQTKLFYYSNFIY